jgi:hypothetical protein
MLENMINEIAANGSAVAVIALAVAFIAFRAVVRFAYPKQTKIWK